MRRMLAAAVTVTALTALPATPAPAADGESDQTCPAPVLADGYDESERWVRVTLTATGCPSRENSRFPLTVRIERSDSAGVDGVDRTVFCGPFRSGVEEGTSYSCDVELALSHPAEEEADYTVYVMWPGHDGTETATFETECVSTESKSDCRDKDQTLTGHGQGGR